MIIKKDSEIVKAKVKWKSLALKARKESSDEECLTSDQVIDEEYAIAGKRLQEVFKERKIRVDNLGMTKDVPKKSRDDKNGILKKFRLEESKPMKTPMYSDTKLTKDKECESVDSTKYQGMIGSLLYLTASRPDIMFSVCLCARFQEAPKTSHLEAVKRIFRYIKGTTHLGLWYPNGTSIEIVVYAEFDHAGDYVDRKSTSGICTFMGCCLTSWFSKKQTTLAISTIESEYVSAEKACQQEL
ncbi:hypothetical protein Tco_1154976 [Tanacetum coccineum]